MKLLVKNILFTLIIPGTVGGYLPCWLGSHYPGLGGVWQWLGIPMLVLGLYVLLVSIWEFWKKGDGTPFPLDPPQNLVTSKWYQRSRNPMYIGVLTCIAGWALWFSSRTVWIYAFAILLIFNLFVTLVEEPLLRKQFGQAYIDYCNSVPRWL